MTEQELFDTVSAHLLTQRKVSIQEIRGCLYFGPDGTRCAVGCLLPEPFRRLFEAGQPLFLYNSAPIEELVLALRAYDGADSQRCEELASDLEEHYYILLELQQIHDKKPVEFWEPKLQNLAEQHGLTFNPPE